MSKPEVAPGITRCWQNFNYHVYMAGPCFDTQEQAQRYKDKLDERGIDWHSQDEYMAPKEDYKANGGWL